MGDRITAVEISDQYYTPGYQAYFLPGNSKQYEYFCTKCLQLRLSFVDVVSCKNCGSDEVITGLPGQLDKEALIKQYRKGDSMANRVVRVNFEGVESGGGVRAPHVPEGDYALKCTKVETKKSKEEQNPYLLFHLKLIKGPKKGVGKTIPHSCSLQKQSLWNLRNLLESMGVQVPSKLIKIPLDKLVGKTCAGTVVDDEYNDREKSSFGAFFPLEELGKTSDNADELEGDEEEEGGEEEEEEEKPRNKKKKTDKNKKKDEEEETTEEEEEGDEDTELFS